MTTVTNLSTLEERTYSLPPVEAVRAAWLQDRGDWNTGDYAKQAVPVTRGLVTVAAGDWCALVGQEIRV